MINQDDRLSCLGLFGKIPEYIIQDVVQIDGRHGIIPVDQPGKVEHILDKLLHALGGRFDTIDHLAGIRGKFFTVAKNKLVCEGPDLPERFLQVMRSDIGKLLKLGVGAVQFQKFFSSSDWYLARILTSRLIK